MLRSNPKIWVVTAAVVAVVAGCGRLAQIDDANKRSKLAAANPAPAPAPAPAANPDEAVEAASESAVLTGSFLTGVGPASDAPAEPGFVFYGVGFFFSEGGAKLDVEVSGLKVEVLTNGDPGLETLALAEGSFATLIPALPKSPWVAHFRVPVRLAHRITEVRVHSQLGAVAVERTITQPNFAPRADAAANIRVPAPVAFAALAGAATLESLASIVDAEETAGSTAPVETPTTPGPGDTVAATPLADPAGESNSDPDTPAAVEPSTTPNPDPDPPTPDPETPAPDPQTPTPDPQTPAPDPQAPSPGPNSGNSGTLTLFVTNAVFSANLGGRSGADAKCDEAGDVAFSSTPSVTWKALISTTENVRDALEDPTVEMVTIGGTVVHPAGDNVFDVGFAMSMMKYANGDPAMGSGTFSGSDSQGYAVPGRTCSNWTENSVAVANLSFPYVGGSVGSFFYMASGTCINQNHLLCYGYVP